MGWNEQCPDNAQQSARADKSQVQQCFSQNVSSILVDSTRELTVANMPGRVLQSKLPDFGARRNLREKAGEKARGVLRDDYTIELPEFRAFMRESDGAISWNGSVHLHPGNEVHAHF